MKKYLLIVGLIFFIGTFWVVTQRRKLFGQQDSSSNSQIRANGTTKEMRQMAIQREILKGERIKAEASFRKWSNRSFAKNTAFTDKFYHERKLFFTFLNDIGEENYKKITSIEEKIHEKLGEIFILNTHGLPFCVLKRIEFETKLEALANIHSGYKALLKKYYEFKDQFYSNVMSHTNQQILIDYQKFCSHYVDKNFIK